MHMSALYYASALLHLHASDTHSALLFTYGLSSLRSLPGGGDKRGPSRLACTLAVHKRHLGGGFGRQRHGLFRDISHVIVLSTDAAGVERRCRRHVRVAARGG